MGSTFAPQMDEPNMPYVVYSMKVRENRGEGQVILSFIYMRNLKSSFIDLKSLKVETMYVPLAKSGVSNSLYTSTQ